MKCHTFKNGVSTPQSYGDSWSVYSGHPLWTEGMKLVVLVSLNLLLTEKLCAQLYYMYLMIKKPAQPQSVYTPAVLEKGAANLTVMLPDQESAIMQLQPGAVMAFWTV